MKRSILLILVMSAALIFFGCEKEEILSPDLEQNALEESALKGAKAGRSFSGICINIFTGVDETGELVNQWYDDTNDWRTTGNSYWVQPDPAIFGGKCTIILDPRNRHEESAGKWEMDWVGEIVFTDDGLIAVGTAEGTGVEGKVKGMKATWTYTMNYVGNDFPNPENKTFFYVVEGKIIPPGHANRHMRRR